MAIVSVRRIRPRVGQVHTAFFIEVVNGILSSPTLCGYNKLVSSSYSEASPTMSIGQRSSNAFGKASVAYRVTLVHRFSVAPSVPRLRDFKPGDIALIV